jgi:tRNA G18 (ribose-2'-O)-methylase SpoU
VTTMIERVQDASDPRLRDYVGLTDVQLRTRVEPAGGMFIAEGRQVIHRAAAAGYPIRSVLTEEKWLAGLADVIDSTAIDTVPVYLADPVLLESVTGFAVHRGALAAMGRLPLPGVAELASAARRIVVVEDVVNHTNLGAVFRSVAALGADAVLVTPRCADPLYRRSVRVSMGTVFQVPWTRLPDWPGDLDLLRAQGFTVAALALAENGVDLDAFAATRPDRLALVLGTEGDGLSPAALAGADVAVRIPMAGGVDSLNVAAAAAVALWALR